MPKRLWATALEHKVTLFQSLIQEESFLDSTYIVCWNRDTDIQNRHRDTKWRKREGSMNWKIEINTYTCLIAWINRRGFLGDSALRIHLQCRNKRCRFHPWAGKIPWRRTWQPSLAFLPGESHGQRSLVGYSPWGHKESDRTEMTKHTCIKQITIENLLYSSGNSTQWWP